MTFKWISPMLLLFITILHIAPAASAQAVFEFDSDEQEQRFQKLTSELRCLVCQNQSLSDSHADLAGDLRQEVFRMIKEKQTDAAIIEFMVQRYGNFVLYRPKLEFTTWALWFGPAVLLLLGIWVMRTSIRKGAALDAILSDDQQRQAERLLGTAPGSSSPEQRH